MDPVSSGSPRTGGQCFRVTLERAGLLRDFTSCIKKLTLAIARSLELLGENEKQFEMMGDGDRQPIVNN